MTSECSTTDIADMVFLRVVQEANSMSSPALQSISTTLASAARHLNEVWNSRRPLFKLPSELLTRIVKDALPWSLDEPSYRYKNPVWRSAARATEALLPISHTCRVLRQAVIDDPTLWRSIATDDPRFIELLLSRTGPTSPLILTLSPRGHPPRIPSTDFQHFSHLAPRLQELHLLSCIEDGSQFPGLKAFLDLPLLQLQYFSITSSTRPIAWHGWNGLLPLPVQNTPNLRYLHLATVLIVPTAPILRLTHLSLWEITKDSFHSITSLLRDCPALTSLVLHGVSFLRRFFTTESVSQYAANTVNPPRLPNLSRVVFAHMEEDAVHYFALLLSPSGPCIQVVPKALHQVYRQWVFMQLYLQCAAAQAGAPQFSIAIHAHEDSSCGTVTGLSVTLANPVRLTRITLYPRLLGRSYAGALGPKWRDNALAPLRTLHGLRELWLTDTDTDTDAHAAAAPLWDFATPDGGDDPDVVFPALESVVFVYDCSAALRRLHPDPAAHARATIQPSIAALPKARHSGATTSTCPNLARVRLAIGYDPADLPRLRESWRQPAPETLATSTSTTAGGGGEPANEGQGQGEGRIELGAKLLRELAPESGSDEYAYVRQAALRVQLMPHLVLDAGELARLRALFAEGGVVVEEIDALPGVPVPERVRDAALDVRGFVPGSVLC